MHASGAIAGPRLDRLDGPREAPPKEARAGDRDDDREYSSLEVLSLAHDHDVDVGRPVGLPPEGIGVAGSPTPHVGVGGRQHHAVGIGPVVVQALPDPGGALGDISMIGALVMHLRYPSALLAKSFERSGPKSVSPAMNCSGVSVVDCVGASWP